MYEQPFNPYAANLAVVKGYFKQTKVLVLGILYIISAVIGIITSIISVSGMSRYITDFINFLKSVGFDPGVSDEELRQATEAASQPSIVSSIPGMIFTAGVILLVAAAFIIIYTKSRNEAPESSPSAGVTILYTLAVISLVFMIIGLIAVVLLVIRSMFLVGTLTSYDGSIEPIDLGNGYQLNIDKGAASAVIIVIGVIALLFMIYSLIFAISKKRFFGSVRESINSVELQNRGAKAYGVLCIINAVFTALGVISSVSSLFGLSSLGLSSILPVAVLSAAASFVSFLSLVFSAMIALGYKKYIDEMKYGYNGAPYGGQGGYNPAPAPNPYAAPRQDYHDGYSNAGTDQRYSSRPSAPAVCPNCGAPADGSPFCGNCGTKL